MASKSTNSTIIVVAIVAIGGYIAWKMFGSGTKKAAAATVQQGVGSGYGSDYYAPQQPTSSGLDIGSLLSSIMSMLGGSKFGSGASGGGSPAASSNGGYAKNSGSNAASTDALNNPPNEQEGANFLGNALGVGENNADYIANQTDASNLGLDSGLSQSLMDLPSFDIPSDSGTFITSANNGSSDAMAGVNSVSDYGPGDTPNYSPVSGGDYGSGLDFSGLDQSYVDTPSVDLPSSDSGTYDYSDS